MGIAPATFYKWKAKYGGLDVSDVQKLKTPEEDHSSLKRIYADLAMDNQPLRDLFSKNGFRKLFAYLRRRGKVWNHKRVYQVYKLLKMNQKRRGKRRLPARVRQPLQQAITVNHSWSMDFISDSIMGVRKFRTFNVMDDCTREALAIEIDTSLSSKRIIRTLESVIAWRGKTPGHQDRQRP